MRIMVFDVPAESGGALSILHEFYNESKKDVNNKYYFVISKPDLQETDNIRVLRFPWIKISWFHRLFFDYFIAANLIRKNKIDKVLSLQNIIIPNTNVFQSLFVHNALPFTDHRISFFEDKLLWVYQNILSKSIFSSIRKANEIIVQTQWMKNKCVEKLKLNESKVVVRTPSVDIKVNKFFNNTRCSYSTFFYPASGVIFKNHQVIIDACLKLQSEGIDNYKVIFTLRGDENKYVINLYRQIQKNQLPIEFIGSISREDVFDYYSKSVLIFPSVIETVGLPLIEATLHNTPILVSSCEYAYDLLGVNASVLYFDPWSAKELSDYMRKSIFR